MEELQQTQPNEESKSKMMDILKRFHEEEETDDFDEEGMLSMCIFCSSIFLLVCVYKYENQGWFLLQSDDSKFHAHKE